MPPGLFEEYFSFTVVRNPFDRLVSAFFYGFPASSRIARDSEASEHQAIIDQFRRFVRSPTVAKVLTMQRFVQDADTDELLVNYVARLETIDADFQYLQQRIGLHRASWLPRANVSKTRPLIPLQAWYDSATIDLVLDRYAVDFKQFGYPLAIPEAV